ncbi:MAG: regulatory protein RecX, partial [Mariprofundaceae bacterium]|nr:regulatory protein RecX [Mariprofundaceae bacterium]
MAGGERQQAYDDAVRLLSRREYCEAEMRARLHAREYSSACIAEVLQSLKQNDYLNERRFAESFLRMRLARGDSLWLATAKARQRGVAEDVLDAVVDALGKAFDAEAACATLLNRRDPAGRRFEDEKTWRRHARYLR